MKKTLWDVILSEAKNIQASQGRASSAEILRGAQNDMSGPVFHGLLCNRERLRIDNSDRQEG